MKEKKKKIIIKLLFKKMCMILASSIFLVQNTLVVQGVRGFGWQERVHELVAHF